MAATTARTPEPLPEPPVTAASPEALYRARCAHFAAERDRLTEQWSRVANLRLFVFVGAVLALVVGLALSSALLVAMAPAGGLAFVVLAVRHGALGRRRWRSVELLRINEEALARLFRTWDGITLRHRYRAAPGHPYAADLDIFGRASLFHLLETVRTSMGERALAEWLAAPASAETVRARQQAVAELAPLVEPRDELQLRGARVGDARPDPDPFLRWAEGERFLAGQGSLVWSARLSPILAMMFALLQVMDVIHYPVWLLFLLANGVLWKLAGSRAHDILTHVNDQQEAFLDYSLLLRLIQEQPFTSPPLTTLQGELTVEGHSAADQVRRLHRLAALSIPSSAMLYAVMQLTTLWDIHVLWLLERWQRSVGRRARRWLTLLGEVEALAALARLTHDHPAWAFPDIDEHTEALTARGLGHPLLPDRLRVDNDVTVGPAGTFLLVTGSNMSGKSTLLRAIGVNAVLAGAGGPVCALSLQMPPLTLWTSMRVQDSLEHGVSYFMAELERLKAVVEAAREARRIHDGRRFLYLLDEILQGTNTAERQIAARRIIAHLVTQGALGAVSSHDLALADEGPLAASAIPVHFAETISRGAGGGRAAMTFDYTLRPGIATSTNALKLMELIGLDLAPATSARPGREAPPAGGERSVAG